MKRLRSLSLGKQFSLPAIALAALAATGAVAFSKVAPSDIGSITAAHLSDVDRVEFLTFSEETLDAFSKPAMISTITRACAITGCSINDLHPAILAYADTMTDDQLDAGRWAQMRLITESLRALDKAEPGTDAADAAYLELTAAARIAHLYTAKLHHLR